MVAVRRSIALVTVAGMVLLVLVAVTGSAGAKAPGPNGQILFGRNDPDVGEPSLFTVNPDGTGERLVVHAPTCCYAWSADGSKISLAANAPDGRVTTALVNPDGSGYEVKTIPDPTLNLECPAWAPDDSRLACEGWDDTNPTRAHGVFTVRASDWGDLVPVTSNTLGGSDIPGDYSPEGTRIAFWREDPARGAPFALFVVNTNGSGLHQISGWQKDFGGASWSPDGQWVLTDNAQGSLYVVHPDGTGRQQISLQVSSRRFAFEPKWSPDGTKIVFALFTARATRTGQEGIYTANADGSDVQRVTSPPTFDTEPDWGPHPLST
jgi:Tol biopolymer transport system component